MRFFVYSADVYCEDCGRAIRRRIKSEGTAPETPRDESSYDSDEYPKGPYADDESDSPQHCGSGPDCLNALELSDGSKVGAFLENALTADGAAYVKAALRENAEQGRGCAEVVQLWGAHYGITLDSDEQEQDDSDDDSDDEQDD